MDDLMKHRWRDGEVPFNGVTVQCPPLRAEALRGLLLDVVPILLEEIDTELATFLDWHQHDGYITRSEVVERGALVNAVESSDAFMEASSDDTFVRRTWYPTSATFLLRWCVSADPDDFGLAAGEPAGDFDITTSTDLAKRIAAKVPGSTITTAIDFFNRAWAG